MRKLLVFAVFFELLLVGCSKSDNYSFVRIPGPLDSIKIKAIHTDLHFYEGIHGGWYFSNSSKKATVPFFCYAPGFTFTCEKKGYTGLYFNLDAKTRDELVICIGKSAGAAKKIFPIKRGMNEILFTNNFLFLEGDEISVKSMSGNPFAVSNPILFASPPKPKRELIFLISVDTLAASHMSLYGYEKETTPNISKFARDSAVFLNAFANSSWTVSSHMSLFTSLLEYGHKVYINKIYKKDGSNPFIVKKRVIYPLSPFIPALTEYLSERYLTISFNGGGNVSSDFGFYRGFDLYLSNPQDMNDPDAPTNLFAQVKTHLETFPFPKVFYFLHTYYVHAPYIPLPGSFPKEEPKPKISRFDFYSDIGGMRGIYKPYPPDFVKDVVSLYDAEIRGFDSAFGEFINYLKSNSLYNNSTIILLSDHGEEFLEHGSWVHASDLYTNQVWIPLLIKFPLQAYRGENIQTPVSLVDVLPTLLESRGMPIPGNLHGQSLMDLITGKQERNEFVISTLYCSKPEVHTPGKISVIRDNIKLIYSDSYPPSAHDFFLNTLPLFEPFELYDLTKDRFEKNNMMNSSRSDPMVKRLLKETTDVIQQIEKSFKNKKRSKGVSLSDELMNQLRALGYL